MSICCITSFVAAINSRSFTNRLIEKLMGSTALPRRFFFVLAFLVQSIDPATNIP